MPRRLSLAAALAVFALATACSPGIHITRYRPAPYNLGATRKVALLNIQGPPQAMGVVSSELSRQIIRDRYFQLYNTQPQTISVVVLPGATIVQNIDTVRTAVPAEVYVSAFVTRWDYAENEVTEEVQAENNVKYLRKLRVPYASVAFQAQVIQAATGRVVVMREYAGHHEGPRYEPGREHPRVHPGEVLRHAAARAVDHFLNSITPATVNEKIVLDDEDKAVEPGIELCKKGALDAAMQAFEKVLAQNPSSAPATYNIAVLLESQGDYARADEMYRKAFGLQPKELYTRALQNMQRRIAEDQSLRQPL